MPADRVSVGSPGGAGGNEIEAVGRELREYGDELRSDWSDFDGRTAKRFLYELADRLDAFRRSPKGEDHEAGIRAAVNAYYERPLDEPLAPGTSLTHFERAVAAYLSRRPSPVSGTEPSGRICDACGEHLERELRKHEDRPGSGTEHEAPPPGKFVSIAANKAMAAPVSGTEPDTAKLRAAIERIYEHAKAGEVSRFWLIGFIKPFLAGFSVDAGKTLDGND